MIRRILARRVIRQRLRHYCQRANRTTAPAANAVLLAVAPVVPRRWVEKYWYHY